MLELALLHKEEIERKSKLLFHTSDYMYYIGYPYAEPININDTPGDNSFQFASLNSKGEVIGYISFNFNRVEHSVDRLGLISFDKGNIILIRDLVKILKMIIYEWKIHRMEWRVIDGSIAKPHYDKFCKKHGGQILHLHDVMKDLKGCYHDEFLYEIIFDN